MDHSGRPSCHPVFVESDISLYQAQAVRAVREKARQAAEERRDVIETFAQEGLSLNSIAANLNDASVRTSRGGVWTATAVKRVMVRLAMKITPA